MRNNSPMQRIRKQPLSSLHHLDTHWCKVLKEMTGPAANTAGASLDKTVNRREKHLSLWTKGWGLIRIRSGSWVTMDCVATMDTSLNHLDFHSDRSTMASKVVEWCLCSCDEIQESQSYYSTKDNDGCWWAIYTNTELFKMPPFRSDEKRLHFHVYSSPCIIIDHNDYIEHIETTGLMYWT